MTAACKRDRVKQCATCPWRVGASTDKIPGYDVAKHRALSDTIDQPFSGTTRIMACHYGDPAEGEERACAGWLHNQYEAGNSLVQISVRLGRLPSPVVSGPQRKQFADTFVNDADLIAMEAHNPELAKAERANAKTLRPLRKFMLPPDALLLQAHLAAHQEREQVQLQAHASPPYCGKCKRPHPTTYPWKGRRKAWHDLGDAQMSAQQLAARAAYEEAFNEQVAKALDDQALLAEGKRLLRGPR